MGFTTSLCAQGTISRTWVITKRFYAKSFTNDEFSSLENCIVDAPWFSQ